MIINAAMQAERQQNLKAEPYQHTEEREGHANGYKPKMVHTRVGNITFAIPQVREGGFFPEALEKDLRSEHALLLALAEMYMQGVSTRKVKVVTEKLCRVAMSSTQVSRRPPARRGDMGLELDRIHPGIGNRIIVGMGGAQAAIMGLGDLSNDHASI